jgi:dihydrofolate reductase
MDPEFTAFVLENALSRSMLMFGRITYELMASYWPTPDATKKDPLVAEQMNDLPKVVFSKTLDRASWNNTTLVKADLAAEVAQLAQADLVDEYEIVLNPIILGVGRTMFDGVAETLRLKLTKTRTFGNGNILLCYAPSS